MKQVPVQSVLWAWFFRSQELQLQILIFWFLPLIILLHFCCFRIRRGDLHSFPTNHLTSFLIMNCATSFFLIRFIRSNFTLPSLTSFARTNVLFTVRDFTPPRILSWTKHFLWLVLRLAVSPMPIPSLANLMLTYFIVLTNQLIYHDHQQDLGI